MDLPGISFFTERRSLPFRGTWLLLFGLASCRQEQTLFTQVEPDHSGVHFRNVIAETPQLNVMQYEYLYNGGGVAAGDFDRDGKCDLYFTGNAVKNRLYLNRGDFSFRDVTDEARVAGRATWKTGVTAADVNADGWLDLYVCYSGPVTAAERANELYLNNGCAPGGVPTFTECAARYGLDAPGTFSTHASFFDYDRDGDLDLFLLNHGNRFYGPFFNTRKLRRTRHPQFGNRLYRNDGNAFTEVSDAAGIDGGGLNFGLSVSVSDVNDDGWPDLYVTNDYEEQDFFYLNARDGTFRECTKQAMGHISRFGMGSDVADINNDARPDLLVVDMLPADNHRQKMLKGPDEYQKYQLMVDSGYHHQNMRNTLQLNRGVGPDGLPVFSEIGQLAGVDRTDWSWAALFADYDNDGHKDLFVTNGYLRDFTNMDFLKFTVEEAKEKARLTGSQIPVYELIGRMPSTKVSNYIFRNNGDLTFADQTKAWGIRQPDMSFGAAYADLDNDGDLDLVTNNTNEPATLWQNHARTRAGSNYLKIKLTGAGKNTHAVGAKVYVEGEDGTQMQELMPSRGYQSAVEPVLLFGLAHGTATKRVRVAWPGGGVSLREGVAANQLLEIRQGDGAPVAAGPPEAAASPLFADVTAGAGVDFTHRENPYGDFHHERLLPYQLSRLGPHLAGGDVDGDGRDDFFVGGAAGQPGRLYLHRPEGSFVAAPAQPWAEDAACEDIGSVFFDADRDGDADLYVVSGGNEFALGAPQLQDRLYLNDGHGTFAKAPAGAIPAEYASGGCVTAGDYDRDGDVDLFVGGRIKPGAYPDTSPGGILRNDTDPQTHRARFTVATPAVNPALREPGLVTDARWTDVNGDGWPDLLVVGEWMPVRIFINQKGKLVESRPGGLEKTGGLWAKILPGDFDGDGDTDYVLGNMGANLPWKASAREPLTLYAGDFDGNGRLDPVLCAYVQGVSYPVASRDELLDQINPLRKKFVKYIHYADARPEDIFGAAALQKARKLEVHTLRTSYLENRGNGQFSLKALPTEAQFSVASGLLAGDYNHDGHADVLLAGNFYPFRVQAGRLDAGMGLLLQGDGKGHFTPVPWAQSGFYAPGDVRDMLSLRTAPGREIILIGKNNDKVQAVAPTARTHPLQ